MNNNSKISHVDKLPLSQTQYSQNNLSLPFPLADDSNSSSSSTHSSSSSSSTSIRLSDGSVYEGPFLNGMMHGQGKITKDGKITYQGGFQSGQVHGYGEMELANGDIYKGHFKRGVFWGQGTLKTKHDGAVYVGSFVDGLQHGEGVLDAPAQSGSYGYSAGSIRIIRKGSFVNEKFIKGTITVKYPNGKEFLHPISEGMDAKDILTELNEGVSGAQEMRNPFCASKRDELKVKLHNRALQKINNFTAGFLKEFEAIKEGIRNAIVQSRKNATQNLTQNELKELKEKKKKEEEAALEALVNSIGLEETPSKKEKQKGKVSARMPVEKKSNAISNSSSSTSLLSSQTERPASVSLDNSYWMSFKDAFKCQYRVLRWKDKSASVIKNFKDFDADGNAIYKYRNLSDDQLVVQRRYHHLPGLERLLVSANENKYYTKTVHPDHTEYHLVAILTVDDTEVHEFGDIVICVNFAGEIYHKKFDAWDLTETNQSKQQYQDRFFKGCALSELGPDENAQWKPVDALSIERLRDGDVELRFQNENYRLQVSCLFS